MWGRWKQTSKERNDVWTFTHGLEFNNNLFPFFKKMADFFAQILPLSS